MDPAAQSVRRLFIPNFAFEDELTGQRERLSRAAQMTTTDLAPLFGVLARPNDFVLLDVLPDVDATPACLQHVKFVTDISQLAEAGPLDVIPFGWTDAAKAIARSLNSIQTPPNSRAVLTVNGRAFSAQHDVVASVSPQKVQLPFGTSRFGVWCTDVEQLCDAQEHLRARGFTSWIAKPAISHAGRNRLRCSSIDVNEQQNNWLRRQIAAGGVYIEPQVTITEEWSLHFDIRGADEPTASPVVDDVGWAGQLTGRTGQYQASLVDRSAVPDFVIAARRHCLSVVEAIADAGYVGPVGIDGFTFRDRSGACGWRFCSDINARFTMGRLALELAKTEPESPSVLWGLYRSRVFREISTGKAKSTTSTGTRGVNIQSTSPDRIAGRAVGICSALLSGSSTSDVLEMHNRLVAGDSA